MSSCRECIYHVLKVHKGKLAGCYCLKDGNHHWNCDREETYKEEAGCREYKTPRKK